MNRETRVFWTSKLLVDADKLWLIFITVPYNIFIESTMDQPIFERHRLAYYKFLNKNVVSVQVIFLKDKITTTVNSSFVFRCMWLVCTNKVVRIWSTFSIESPFYSLILPIFVSVTRGFNKVLICSFKVPHTITLPNRGELRSSSTVSVCCIWTKQGPTFFKITGIWGKYYDNYYIWDI